MLSPNTPTANFFPKTTFFSLFHAFALSVAFESNPQSHTEAAQVLELKVVIDSKVDSLIS